MPAAFPVALPRAASVGEFPHLLHKPHENHSELLVTNRPTRRPAPVGGCAARGLARPPGLHAGRQRAGGRIDRGDGLN